MSATLTIPTAEVAAGAAPQNFTRTAGVNPLLIGRDQLAESLGIGIATLDRLDAAGKLPPPVRLGGRKLWSVSTVTKWIDAGCPDRAEFEAREKARAK